MSLWTPANLGSILKAWFDFSDLSTITDAGAGAVSDVLDKSGYGNHITAAVGARPITGSATQNGLNVLVFDGVNDEFSRQSNLNLPNSGGNGATVCVLRKFSSGTSGGLCWIAQQGASFGDAVVVARDSGNMGVWGNGTSTSVGISALYADSDNTNWHLSSATQFTSSRTIYEDGVTKTTNNNSIGSSPVTSFFIGHALAQNRATNIYFNGQMAEVVIIDGRDIGKRQLVEGYMMWKWGIQANLPVDHPFAKSAPQAGDTFGVVRGHLGQSGLNFSRTSRLIG